MKNIVILISGRGSNLRAIVEAARAENWPARIAAVISSNRDAPGLDIAESFGIPAVALDSRDYPSREAFDGVLQAEIERHAPDLVVLAGFMRILTTPFVEHFRGRMINIHPSLLPRFPGLHTHRQALEAGVREHGATVHVVTPELDHGPILAQVRVPVMPDDTEASLAARVLKQEHLLYPRAIRQLLEEGMPAMLAPRPCNPDAFR